MASEETQSLVLESLRNDVAQVGDTLRAISQRVIEEGISDYPVYVAAQDYVDIGKPIFDRDSLALNWFFFASILEDFVKREMVRPANLGRFKKAFGDPMEKACIFVITEEGGKFVFVPYQIED